MRRLNFMEFVPGHAPEPLVRLDIFGIMRKNEPASKVDRWSPGLLLLRMVALA